MAKLFTKILLSATALMMLAGCESVDNWMDKAHYSHASDSSETETNASPAMGKDEVASVRRLESAPGVRDIPQFPAPQDRDLKVMTNKLSGGSVEIYDIDSATVPGAPVAPVSAMSNAVGIPMTTDPRVTIYPLDGGSTYPGQFSAVSAPQGWPNSVVPMGKAYDSTMTPAPDGDDAPMSIGLDGKLQSREGVNVSNIYFPYGSARLDGNDRQILSRVAETAKFAPVERVSIEGHASHKTQTNDPVKAKILNLKESMNRAYAVSQDLIEKGVPAEKIKAVGWGDTKVSGQPEPAQRRVDIFTGTAQ